jgi:hypothetical protein
MTLGTAVLYFAREAYLEWNKALYGSTATTASRF